MKITLLSIARDALIGKTIQFGLPPGGYSCLYPYVPDVESAIEINRLNEGKELYRIEQWKVVQVDISGSHLIIMLLNGQKIRIDKSEYISILV